MTADLKSFMAFYDATCDDAYRLAHCYTGDVVAAGDAVVRAYVQAFASPLGSRLSPRAELLAIVQKEAS